MGRGPSTQPHGLKEFGPSHTEKEKEAYTALHREGNQKQATNRSSRISEEGNKKSIQNSTQATNTFKKPLKHNTFSLTKKVLLTKDNLQIQKKWIDREASIKKKSEREKEKEARTTLHREGNQKQTTNRSSRISEEGNKKSI